MEDCRKKIVHLCLSNFYIDDYSYQENILPKYHVKLGFDVTVIASLVSFNSEGKGCLLPNSGEYMSNDGYKVVRMNYRKWPSLRFCKRFRLYTSTYTLLKREKPDILFIHGTSFGDITQVCKYLRKHPAIKVYADSHADWINSGRNWLSLQVLHKIIWKHYTQMLLPYLQRIYGVLPIRCQFLIDIYGVPRDMIELLPLGVDDDAIPQNRQQVRSKIRKEFGVLDDDIVIITGGKINNLKRIHYLMKAVNELNSVRVRLFIFGTIADDFRKEFEENLSDKITFVGWSSPMQIINYMLASDIACFPGTHSILWEQAVGLSLPCIFRDWKGIHHVNVNGNCIFLKEDSVNAIIEAIEQMLEPSFYSKIRELASVAAGNFLYSNISKKAIGLY